MGDVITSAVQLACPHKAPIATVTAGKLTASSSPVLQAAEVQSGTLSCPADKPCLKVASVGGSSAKLTIGGSPAAISPLDAATNIGPVSTVPAAVKLKAS